MCGRSSLTKTEKEIEERFRATFYSEELERYNPLPNYNVAPTHMCPVITSQDFGRIHLYQWGLVPSWSKDKKIGSKLINARIESLTEKPMFNALLKTNRCIIPMDGFYEWKRNGNAKIPFRIITKDQKIFAVAGLWSRCLIESTGELIFSFTVITNHPNVLMEKIHDRMPAILMPENEKIWLDETIPPKEALEVIFPYSAEQMEAYEVANKVNNVRENDASLIWKVDKNPDSTQLSLF
jgi:putative SOS response-associated peptidase YedK